MLFISNKKNKTQRDPRNRMISWIKTNHKIYGIVEKDELQSLIEQGFDRSLTDLMRCWITFEKHKTGRPNCV